MRKGRLILKIAAQGVLSPDLVCILDGEKIKIFI